MVVSQEVVFRRLLVARAFIRAADAAVQLLAVAQNGLEQIGGGPARLTCSRSRTGGALPRLVGAGQVMGVVQQLQVQFFCIQLVVVLTNDGDGGCVQSKVGEINGKEKSECHLPCGYNIIH